MSGSWFPKAPNVDVQNAPFRLKTPPQLRLRPIKAWFPVSKVACPSWREHKIPSISMAYANMDKTNASFPFGIPLRHPSRGTTKKEAPIHCIARAMKRRINLPACWLHLRQAAVSYASMGSLAMAVQINANGIPFHIHGNLHTICKSAALAFMSKPMM